MRYFSLIGLSVFAILLGALGACSRAEYVPSGVAALAGAQDDNDSNANAANPGDATGAAGPGQDDNGNADGKVATNEDNKLIFGALDGDLSGDAVIDWGQDLIFSWELPGANKAKLTLENSLDEKVQEKDITDLPTGQVTYPTGNTDLGLFPGVYEAILDLSNDKKELTITLPFVIRPTIDILKETFVKEDNGEYSIEVDVPAGGDKVEVYVDAQADPVVVMENVTPGTHRVNLKNLEVGDRLLIAQVEKNKILGLPDRETVTVVGLTLDDLCKTAVTKTITIKVPNAKNCPFGEGDNLSERQHWLTARVEFESEIPVSDGHILCSIKSIKSKPDQKIRYDDHLILAFDNLLFLSSFNVLDRLDKADEFYKYDWLKLRGDQGLDLSADFDSSPFCLAEGANCVIPPHDKEGVFDLKIDEAVIKKMITTSGIEKTHKIKTVLFGDNNKFDCEIITSDSEDLELNIEITEAQEPVK